MKEKVGRRDKGLHCRSLFAFLFCLFYPLVCLFVCMNWNDENDLGCTGMDFVTHGSVVLNSIWTDGNDDGG